MAVDERSRHELYEQPRRTWSDQAADALMELLPPVGWADVATKHDLDALESRFEAAIDRAAVKLIMWLIPLNIGLAFGAARLG